MRKFAPISLILMAVACGESDPTETAGPVVRAELLPADTVISMPTMFTGQGIDENGVANADAVVTWQSLTPAVITVDEMGLVTPVSAGIGQVQITVEAFTAQATVRSVFGLGSAAGFNPLFSFTSGPNNLRIYSDVSQADADSRSATLNNVWTHGAAVFNSVPSNTSMYFTEWREIWAQSIAFCGGVDDPAQAAHTFCPNPPRHFLVGTPDNASGIRYLAQQFMSLNYSAADAFPWLKEGWSSWLSGGSFDAAGMVSIPGPRQAIVDDFDAADGAGNLAALADLLNMPAGTFYQNTPPVPQLVAQATLFWGWLVTEQSSAAGEIFNRLRLTNGNISNADLLGDMFAELGMDVGQVEPLYLAWARAR